MRTAGRRALHASRILLAATVAATLATPAAFAQEPPGLPSRALIPGVPFISWSEARQLEYQDKNVLNPSFAASLGMILRYWGQDLELLKSLEKGLPREAGWGSWEIRHATAIDELKPYLARGVPLYVAPAITAVAHPISLAHFILASSKGFKFSEKMLASGVLGRMVPLHAFKELTELMKVNPASESLHMSARVVIGYDDDRKILILHDPTFGPAWAIAYDSFDAMWGGAFKRMYIVAHPVDHAERLRARPPAAAYLPPSPEAQAAADFVWSYALSSVGRVAEGETLLMRALALPRLGPTYQHLLLFELALHRNIQGRRDEAVALAERAIALLPEHHRPWRFLAQIYRSDAVAPQENKAAEAERKAEALCADRKAQETVLKALGNDFFVFGGCPSRPPAR